MLILTDNPNPFIYYYRVTPLEMAVFVLVPLYAALSLPEVRMLENVNFCTRLKNRESTVYCYALLVLSQAIVFAAFINVTAVLILLARSSVVFDLAEFVLVSAVSTALGALFFSACALLLLAVYALTKKIQLAAIALFCYAVWDFLSTHIPYYASILPVVGWRLTQFHYPASVFEVSANVLSLFSLIVVLVCANLVIARRRDFALASEV
jgi:hypothetical protein